MTCESKSSLLSLIFGWLSNRRKGDRDGTPVGDPTTSQPVSEPRSPSVTISPGMQAKDVFTLLGSPKKVATLREALDSVDGYISFGSINMDATLCVWERPEGKYTVFFKNGLVDNAKLE